MSEVNEKQNWIIWGTLFALAALIRFLNLGLPPLSSTEAAVVLPALNLANHSTAGSFADTLYTLITALTFYLQSESGVMARMLPAISGSLLVISPLFFRKYLPGKTPYILAYLIMLDPASVAASRQAGSTTLALLAIMILLYGIVENHKSALAIGLVGVLLTGPSSWIYALPVAAALLIAVFSSGIKPSLSKISIAETWPVLAILVASATLLFIYPVGLGSVGEGIARLFKSDISTASISFIPLILLLLATQPLGFVLGLVRIIRSRLENSVDLFLAAWFVFAIIIAAINPNRTPLDLVNITLPLLALASRNLQGLTADRPVWSWQTLALATVVLAFLVFIWLRVLSFANPAAQQASDLILAASILLPILLIGGASLIVSWWVDTRTALTGLAFGIIAAAFIWTSSFAWHATGLPQNGWSDIWRSSGLFLQENALRSTLGQLSTWQTREDFSLELNVVNMDDPLMRWALRDYSNAKFAHVVDKASSSAVVLTPEDITPNDPLAYQGQSFVRLQSYPLNDLTPVQWFDWLTSKQLPKEQTNLVLWARSDLFPNGTAKP